MTINTILNEDCVKGMRKELQNESVDLVLTDPPYVISRPSQLGTMPDRKNPRTGTDFGQWDKEFNNLSWLKQAGRVLKKGGSLVVFNDVKKISTIIKQAEQAGLQYKDTLIWHKTNPMPRNIQRRYVSDIEIAIWFVKPGASWTFNCINKPYMSCVKTFAVESGGGFKRIHPTQKPLKLITSILLTHSNPNDLVLDPFMGSGTTALACVNEKRRYIGFEIDKKYFDACEKRIDDYEANQI